MEILGRIIRELAVFYNEMAVFLLFGFIIAGILHVFFPESLIRRHLGKKSMNSVLKSTLFGMPLPLCSCGVVPVAASLRKSGASKGATAAFLTSTPQIGADSFLITYSLLGGIFALFRVAASFLTAVLVGGWVNLFHLREQEDEKPVPGLSEETKPPETSIREKAASIPYYIEYELLGSLANSLVAGIILAGIIAVVIPEDFFARTLNNSFLSMIVMMLIGIPMYVCASASTPIAASLVYKGISPGAALVFLLTGPATNAVTIASVFRLLGRKAGVAYLSGIALTALVLGFGLNLWVMKAGLSNVILHHHHTGGIPGWLKLGGSVILGLMLLWHYIQTKIILRRKGVRPLADKKIEMAVLGMTCLNCAGRVKKAVESVQGASEIIVDMKKNMVRFELTDKNRLGKVREAVQRAGYDVPG